MFKVQASNVQRSTFNVQGSTFKVQRPRLRDKPGTAGCDLESSFINHIRLFWTPARVVRGVTWADDELRHRLENRDPG